MRNFLYGIVFIFVLASCKKEVETKAVVQDIKELVFASGQIEWKNTYDVVSQTDGVLENFTLEVGDWVKQSSVIAQIDNKTANENLASAQKNVELSKQSAGPQIAQIEEEIQFAQKKYEQDKVQADRYERLYQKQSVSKNDFENAKLTAENSFSQLSNLKQKLQSTKLQNQQNILIAQTERNTSKISKEYTFLKASVAGKVIMKNKELGDYVKKGDVIATLADDRSPEVILNVDENSISKVKVGQKVFIRLNTEKDKTLEGKISFIYTAFDQDTQSFVCKATLTNSTVPLLYGTPLEANILIGEKKSVLLLPRSVVGYGNQVRVKGKKENVILKTGIVSTDYVEVLEGITTEDIILPLKP